MLLFDGTDYLSAPSRPLPGLHPIGCWTRNQLCDEQGEIDPAAVDRTASLAESLMLRYINIEHWPIGMYEPRSDEAARKLATICDRIHYLAPGVRLGIYSILPDRNYWDLLQFALVPQMKPHPWWVANELKFAERVARWEQHNMRIGAILQRSVDVLFPSLYTFESMDGVTGGHWALYAHQTIQRCRQMFPGKPIIPFIWPEYHQGSARAGEPISLLGWSTQLHVLAEEQVDGAVIWGGWGKSGRQTWSYEMPWWKATCSYIAKGV